MQRFMRQKRHLGHISTHFWHGSRPVVIGPHTKCMTSMTSMTSTARVRARSRAPYIRKLFFLIFFIFSKFQSDCWYGLIQENRKMPSEWLGVHGGRSYGPSPRGSSKPGPATIIIHLDKPICLGMIQCPRVGSSVFEKSLQLF